MGDMRPKPPPGWSGPYTTEGGWWCQRHVASSTGKTPEEAVAKAWLAHGDDTEVRRLRAELEQLKLELRQMADELELATAAAEAKSDAALDVALACNVKLRWARALGKVAHGAPPATRRLEEWTREALLSREGGGKPNAG